MSASKRKPADAATHSTSKAWQVDLVGTLFTCSTPKSQPRSFLVLRSAKTKRMMLDASEVEPQQRPLCIDPNSDCRRSFSKSPSSDLHHGLSRTTPHKPLGCVGRDATKKAVEESCKKL